MATKIEWATETWNPVTGCTKISPACDNCYAERMSKRMAGRFGYPKDDPFRVTMHPEKLAQPLQWKKPRRIFVVSMGDLFHKDVPSEYIAAIFGMMAACPQHTWMLLTKRPDQAREWFDWANRDETYEPWDVCRKICVNTMPCGSSLIDELKQDPIDQQVMSGLETWPLPNVWLGVTAEDQQRADERIPELLQIPAAKHFASCEPMRGAIINMRKYLEPSWSDYCEAHDYGTTSTTPEDCPDCSFGPSLDWVIAGGETGPRARPMNPDWVRSLRDQCIESGTPFFFKSWGEWSHNIQWSERICQVSDDGWWQEGNGYSGFGRDHKNTVQMYRSGKKFAGRVLDGRTWEEIPEENK